MQVSYGPPAQRGVTSLMAVGAVDIDESATDQRVRGGSYGALAVAALGVLMGSRTIRDVGIGGAVALFAIRLLKQPQVVAVTSPPAAP